MSSVHLCWFRRDLRLEDQTALYHALHGSHPVIPVFVFDTNILHDLEFQDDRRVTFIHDALTTIQEQLLQTGSTLDVFHGTPLAAFEYWTKRYEVTAVYTNHDYEPYARERDNAVAAWLAEKKIPFHTFKDQVIFEKDEVVKKDGTPYTVFTPYSRQWLARLDNKPLQQKPAASYINHFFKQPPIPVPSLAQLGFIRNDTGFPEQHPDETLIRHYDQTRDIPAVHGTSRVGVSLRFGTISIRQLVHKAATLNQTYLKELIWREFFQMILWHFPNVAGHSFKPAYDLIPWRNNEKEFAQWCAGQTGYPIVDAGMRELNATGFMHNRVRMITAGFLTKHLLTDWRWGEAYFASRLLDYDLAANNGGWQWAAGCGCDAAPYFRVFNPALQTKKFDPDFRYIRKWVPEFDTPAYPRPIVEHEIARKRALEVYGQALRKSR